ncbi:SsrA-binding protein [Candidatus Kaiserbacteria bacterium RIFCSPLOWO2_02_FULL_45_11b]|uniref:SsrA-binding protein n=1 Tax=Candidatus Kaiserbacteria bacterium RIFCSPLOWO2_12_FULL_45_26 TaxID=1798525 RepID=A0A1F6FFX8_9BACT|nr:MAG: SsrA-binding protein [Candidatus Kaiserbacteria bacterium RIFCSPHIGHO2_12_45_16]OGG70544.1 MAG: SsrA-binding protein [Candidatus Kaiserbacteria bacterium RIFCSPLOWO2_01_FULL_45_25]OGG80817.1 MAG: SsrA-binding protein [Candidatus Kaiserbacteria bacterium RIFCSPLOWO2_02_FULL_45_11b]OGG84772.1 MAG: SsrA-binding protein [Candidatus Kaiserbacteria bacterium RIFCSPLOWO2_12_FULL_45_26]
MSDFVQNKKAYFDYEFLEQYEAGVVLTGHEVKSIRANKASLNGAYVIIRGKEAYLVNASISPYQVANTPKGYDPERARKLLLSKKQIEELEQGSERNGLTIVATRWYNNKRKVKLGIALARGKKKADKRETLKARDNKREIDRIMKSQ